MKLVITEQQAKRIVREMLLNEISSADAYAKFYSKGGKFIHKDIYDSLMNGTAVMTPFHKMMLDAFLAGKVNANLMQFAGDIWRGASNDMKQYLIHAVEGDLDYITDTGGSIRIFLEKVSSMKSHSERSFNDRGYEVLYEDEGVKVTCTKSYTSSCKNYGNSHWCTASDIFGEYNGYDMFRNYTNDNGGGCLVQFICKKFHPEHDGNSRQSRILGLNDYNLLGKPREDVINDLQSEHYDLLIDLTTRPLLPLRYLVLFADADFKVGMNLGEGIHDMLISLPDFSPEQGDAAEIEASWLFNQIMEYLTTIRSMD